MTEKQNDISSGTASCCWQFSKLHHSGNIACLSHYFVADRLDTLEMRISMPLCSRWIKQQLHSYRARRHTSIKYQLLPPSRLTRPLDTAKKLVGATVAFRSKTTVDLLVMNWSSRFQCEGGALRYCVTAHTVPWGVKPGDPWTSTHALDQTPGRQSGPS